MHREPSIEVHAEKPCVHIPATVTMTDFSNAISAVPEVFGWLDQRNVKPAGPMFFRYLVIDMDRELELEVGVPLDNPVEGNGRIISGVIPGGTYATLMHHGHPDRLIDSHAALQGWLSGQGLEVATHQNGGRELLSGRYEFYLSDPDEEPDMDEWSTEIAYLLADGGSRKSFV
jgi:effector-binding domain-containing protein